jgi:hypothetical protein
MYGTYLRLNVTVWASDRGVIRAARSKLTRSAQRDARSAHRMVARGEGSGVTRGRAWPERV